MALQRGASPISPAAAAESSPPSPGEGHLIDVKERPVADVVVGRDRVHLSGDVARHAAQPPSQLDSGLFAEVYLLRVKVLR